MSNPSSFRTLKTLLVSTIVISLAACSSVPQEQANSSQSTTPQTTTTSPETTPSPSETAANPSPAETTATDVPKVEEIKFKEVNEANMGGNLEVVNDSPKLKQTVSPDKPIVIQGWAVLPVEKKPADQVLITVKDGNTILSTGIINIERKDVADFFKTADASKSGWKVEIAPKTLPTGKVVLQAWAYDSKTKEAYPIRQNPELEVK